MCLFSDEGAVAGDGAADDQGIHLPGALVGVDRLGVGDVPAGILFQQAASRARQGAAVLGRPEASLPPHAEDQGCDRRGDAD